MAEKVEKKAAGQAKVEKTKTEKPKASPQKSDKPNFLQRGWMAFRRYINETIGELRKVQWPTRKEAINLTIVVLVVSIVMAFFLGGLDFIFSRILSLVV